MKIAYKLARPDGWDFFTGGTIQYRADKYPHIVRVPNSNPALGTCSAGVGHASSNPNDCFIGAKIPCSAYKLEFEPVCGDIKKWGWTEANVLEEITDLDNLFGWKYSEVINPVNPFLLPPREPTAEDLLKLKQWASVRDSVWSSVGASVRDSVWSSVRDSVRDSVWSSVRDSVWSSVWSSVGNSGRDSVWSSVRDSVRDSVGAYISSLFPGIKVWENYEHLGENPFQPCVELWKRGFVASYDGKIWRLHSGSKAKIVWQGKF